MLVICLFDVQQRPSRNMLAQLAQKVEPYAKRGIIILGISAGKIEPKKLQPWLRENRIRVPVGTVQTDEDQTCCAWGARSLPWLILTDARHVVRAEGFALSELDVRIEPLLREPAGTGSAHHPGAMLRRDSEPSSAS